MTLNRYLLLFAILVVSALGVLAFGNPQWNKWIYMFRNEVGYYDKVLFGSLINTSRMTSEQSQVWVAISSTLLLLPENDHTGTWKTWRASNSLNNVTESGLFNFKKGKLHGIQRLNHWGTNDPRCIINITNFIGDFEVIYFKDDGIDRRAEFGIEVK